MSQSPDLSAMPEGPHGPFAESQTELRALRQKILTAEGPSARHLPVQVLSYLAKSLNHIEIDIHVEECLPMVCDASHAFVRAMGTFSQRHADDEAVEQSRIRLIQALETVADEMRLCKVRMDPPPLHGRTATMPVRQSQAGVPSPRQGPRHGSHE